MKSEYSTGLKQALIIDNDDTSLHLYVQELTVLGFRVIIEKNAPEALVWLRSNTADLVIYDLNLVGNAVYEILEQLHDNSRSMHGICIYDGNRRNLQAEVERCHPHGLLQRPFNASALRKTMMSMEFPEQAQTTAPGDS